MNDEKRIKIIGHRGAPALEPENTLLSLQKAIDMGCDMIEIDARTTKDGEVVLMHDPTLNRTTDGIGPVFEKTLKELKKLDAGRGEKIPTLKEVWDLSKNRTELNIEIREKKVLDKVISFIKKEQIKNQVLISSRYYRLIAKAKKTNPLLRIGFISYHYFASVWQALRIKAESLHPATPIVTQRLVKKAHRNGIKVYPFPLGIKKENPKDLKGLIKMGIDGIILNDPSAIKDI